MNEKARAEQLIAEIRELVKNNSTDIARLRQLTGDLQQVAYGLQPRRLQRRRPTARRQTQRSAAIPGGISRAAMT